MSDDRDRLLQVAAALAEAANQPARPGGKRRLPVVQASDAAGLVAMMHEQLDQAIEHREVAAAEAGLVIACQRGCAACCTTPVVVGEHEAVAVARWLAQPEQAATRARFLAGYPAWRARLGPMIEAVVAAADDAERERAGTAYRARHAMCPFNHGGDCTIYAVRPALCRKAHALGTSDQCQQDDGQLDYLAHPEVEATHEQQESLRTVLHHALRPGRPGEALPKAVLRRLMAATAFPNQPCPCGSGEKHKRCCGAG